MVGSGAVKPDKVRELFVDSSEDDVEEAIGKLAGSA